VNDSKKNQMDIDYVSNLARIDLTKEEKIKFNAQLGNVLSYFEKLQEVDTQNVEPTAHAFSRYNIWDDDITKKPFSQEEVLKNAPDSRSQQIVVPKVIED